MAVLLECTACYQNYAVPKEASARPPVCPWCGALSAPVGNHRSGGAFPQLGSSRFPRRRRTMPALVWLVIGVGLGACVVLSALVIWWPDILHREKPTEESTVVRGSPDPAQRLDRRSSPLDRVTGRPAVAAAARSGDRATTEARDRARTEAVVRQLVREEMGLVVPSDPREPAEVTTRRWLSNRPPPIGDPEDDSPGLGLMLREREPERRGSPPSSLDASDREPPAPKKTPPARALDDAAAVSALAAAGIRCDKDADTGLVHRVDGSFRMTDALIPHVAQLPGLVHLKLSFADVTDAGLAHIKYLTALRELILNQTKLTDAGLAHLESLVNLEKLDLEKTLVSDACLGQLKSLKRLRHVDVRGTQITQAGADGLKKALPSAKVRH